LNIVPMGGFQDVVFGLRTRNDLPFHDFDPERSLLVISSNDTEELGAA
jgi:hypothetical protein